MPSGEEVGEEEDKGEGVGEGRGGRWIHASMRHSKKLV